MSVNEKLVVVGNGMAGMRAVEELLAIAPDLYDITVFGDEPHGNYNRIQLSPVLSGEATFDAIVLNRPQWYAEHGITLHAGRRVVRIDRVRRRVVADDGTEAPYDRLLIATGSRPFILPVPGHELPGVSGFRTIADVETMLDAARSHRHAVVIGGGLLGLEAAAGLIARGMKVRVVHLMPWLMERQLDEDAARQLQGVLEKRGVEFLLQAKTKELVGRKRVQGVILDDGREISADLVVMTAGIRPNLELARDSGIHCERGIVVSDTMQTYDPRVYAVGECVQHRGQVYGLVAPLFEQARVCANHLARLGYGRYTGSLTSTKLKVTGVDVFSAGDFTNLAGAEQIVYRDPAAGVYKKIVLRGGRVQGAVLYGDTGNGAWYFQLMREGTDVSALREHLMFGQAHLGDSGRGGSTSVTAMPDDREVCGCNGVTKGMIVKAIREKGLFTLEEVRAHTKASASCGGCTGLVEQILASVVGSEAAAPEKKPLCGCTAHGHEEIREAIRVQHLTSARDVMRALEWRTPDGCPSCRMALNYYVVAAWPAEAEDAAASRFVNERVHANIQRDRTYTVVPRIAGGVATPADLRAIADVAEKYAVPLVKLTGGQRIDLVGVTREQLPAVWADLGVAGLASGYAYGKSLRTVKTCIGSRFCRFGTQDSIGMGIRLEELTWGSWTPAKVKMAVSGCPRNCAEATIKDFGVVAVESGWELHVGGNGGVKVRVTDLLCRVKTAEEVEEYGCAFLQLYRDEARYLERTAHWVERVGLPSIKARIEDADSRRALHARFIESQRYAQIDPWAERAGEKRRADFAPLARIDVVTAKEEVNA